MDTQQISFIPQEQIVPLLYLSNGDYLRPLDPVEYIQLWETSISSYCYTIDQIAEVAGFSYAMVLRQALAYSTEGSQLGFIVSHSPAGKIALACARMMASAGCNCSVLIIDAEYSDMRLTPHTSNLSLQIKQAQNLGIDLFISNSKDETTNWLSNKLELLQHVVMGTWMLNPYSENSTITKNTLSDLQIKMLNDSISPIHAIETPEGITIDGKTSGNESLYCSTTLGLGLPHISHFSQKERCGRLYVCDISIPCYAINEHNRPTPLFKEQPVVQLFNKKPTMKM
jgi:hypothetical protein